MVFAAIGAIPLSALLELWILRILVVTMGASGLWLFGRERLRREVGMGEGCPRCGSTHLYRVHRKSADRLFGFGMHVHRYRCKDPSCGWEGLMWSHPSVHQHIQN